MTRCSILVFSLLIALGHGAQAFAQKTSETQESDEDSGETLDLMTIYGAGYRSTGTKSKLRPIDSPMSFEVYDAQMLQRRQVDSVNEALRYVSGITPESRPSVTIFDQYTIRGFESYRNFYDGLPLQYNNLWNLVPQVDMFATESVEVLRGPTSVLYGYAPPGGMVNQTAKQPMSARATRLRARVGSHNFRELAIDATGAVSDTVNGRLIALARQKDGQQRTTEEERYTFAPSLTWQPSARTSLNLNLYYQDDPEMIPSTPLPGVGALHEAPYGLLQADAYAGDRKWATFEREVLMVGYKLNHLFSDKLSFLQNFRFTDASALQHNTYNSGLLDDQQTLVRSAYLTDEDNRGFVIDNQLALSSHLAGAENRLLLGLDYQRLKSGVRYGDTLTNDTPTIDLSAPNYDLIDPAALPLDFYTESHNIEQTQVGVYLQNETQWQRLTLLAGLRWDRYDSTDIADNSYAGSAFGSETDIDQDELSGRLSAMYRFDNGLSPYLGYSESYEPTAGTDAETGEAFKPTTASQVEVGVKYQSSDMRTQLTAAYFDLRKQNVVVNTPDFMRSTQNGEVQSEGVELSIEHRFSDNFDVLANLTRMQVEITENPLNPSLVGNTPVWVAEKQASLWANFYPSADWEVNGGVRYIGESQLDAANSGTVASYALFDLALSYRLNQAYRVGLTASNLTDKRYVGACFDINNCWMGAERSVELNLYARF